MSCRDDWDNHQDQHSSQSSGDGASPQDAEEKSYSRKPEPVPSRKTNGRFSSTESQVTIYGLLHLFFPLKSFIYSFLIGILTMSSLLNNQLRPVVGLHTNQRFGEKSINTENKIKMKEKCIQYR